MILVTGGSGMLGRAVIAQLLEQGRPVRNFDLVPYPDANVESVVGDICDYEHLTQACTGITGIVHVASLVDLHLGEPKTLYDVNVNGVKNLIAACQERGIQKLVYMSSAEVICGSSPLRHADESEPYPDRHLTYYGVTKEDAERLVLTANNNTLATCAFRSLGIYGEGDRNFVARAIDKTTGKRIPLIGAGNGITNVTYAGNVAHALLIGLEQLSIGNPISGQVFHITDSQPQSVQQFIVDTLAPFGYQVGSTIPLALAMMLARFFALPYRLTHAERFARPLLTRHQILLSTQDYYLDSTKSEQLLGYAPRFEQAEAIIRTRSWLAESNIA